MKFALIGHPVAGSLSPRLIAAAYDGRHTYDLLDFEHFEDAWKAFVVGYDGINVTAPFKQDAFARVDVLSPQAQATGAVNLVTRSDQGFVGYNTDVDGVLMALRETGLSFADALVVGTGGAAKAAVHAAQLLGCKVTVTGRSLEKAAALGCPAVPLPEAGSLNPLHPPGPGARSGRPSAQRRRRAGGRIPHPAACRYSLPAVRERPPMDAGPGLCRLQPFHRRTAFT